MDRCRLINYFRVQVELNRFEEENFKTHSDIHLHSTFLLSEIVSVKYEPAEKSAVTEKVSF